MGQGKKKRGHPDIEEILGRPWCYYCERDFDDLKILINHQKAKHFKCDRCGRRLNTAGGLSVHLNQVHKETLTAIENALPNRSNLDVEIFGMEGIPGDVVSSHNQRVLSQFAQAEADRRAATGNPAPGGAQGSAPKKPKFESPSDLKKRLAEHKAKIAAEKAAGVSSGDATPIEGSGTQSPAFGQTPGFSNTPPYSQQQIQYGAPPNTTQFSAFPQPYAQPATTFPPQQGFPQPAPGFQAAPGSFGQPGFSQSQYPPASTAFAPPQFPTNGLPQFPGAPQRAFGANSPPMQAGAHPPPHLQPSRPSTLPAAPGLPQRPAFGAPPVNQFQMQQMHQGQLPGPPIASYNEPGASHGLRTPIDISQNGAALQNGTINGISQASEAKDKSNIASNTGNANQVTSQPSQPKTEEKKSKKDKEKDKKTRMVYSDDEISPEEKMARLPRYAFAPNGTEVVMGGAAPAITA